MDDQHAEGRQSGCQNPGCRAAIGFRKDGIEVFQIPCVVAGRRGGDLTPNLFYEHSAKMRQLQQNLLEKQA